MTEAILLGPVLRIALYISVPIVLSFVYKDKKPSSVKLWLLLIIWGVAATFIATMVSGVGFSYNIAEIAGALLGGGIVGAIIGDIAYIIASRLQKPKENAVQTEPMQTATPGQGEKAVSFEAESVSDEAVDENTAAERPADAPSEQEDADTPKTEKPEAESYKIPEEELRLLKKLYDSGILTEAEFKEKKKMLLKI